MIMEATAVQAVERNIVSVALASIQPSNYNPRKNFDEASLAELAESIKQQGVLQPIGVRPVENNRFEIVFGERRYRASQMTGLEVIPAIVMEISDEVAEEMAVTENLQRKDVTPIEEANAYQSSWRAVATMCSLWPCNLVRARIISIHASNLFP